MDDPYATLGLEAGASDHDIRSAYRRLAMKWHPDRAGEDRTFVFQKITAAYEVLSDPARRAAYDAQRLPTMRAPGELLRRLSGSLDALLARGVAHREGDDLIELLLESDEVRTGGMLRIAMRVPVTGGGDEVFSAWLALRPGTPSGAVLSPSAQLPDVVRPVRFRVRY